MVILYQLKLKYIRSKLKELITYNFCILLSELSNTTNNNNITQFL